MMAVPSPFIQYLAQDFFRAERPPLSECYRRAVRVSKHYECSVSSAAEAGRIIRKLARNPEFRAYRKPGGGYLQRLESI